MQAVFVDELFEVAFDDEAAREKIEPNGLTVLLQRSDRVHCYLLAAICAFAAARTFSGVKPNFFSKSL